MNKLSKGKFYVTSHHESFFDRCLVSSQYTRSCLAKIGLFTEMESFLHLTRGLKATDHVPLILPRPQLLFLSPLLVENSLHRCHLDHLKNQLRGKMCCDYNLVTCQINFFVCSIFHSVGKNFKVFHPKSLASLCRCGIGCSSMCIRYFAENEPFSTAERSERVENFLFRATRE